MVRELTRRARSTNGVAEIKAHPFFAGVVWDTLYLGSAPVTPELAGELDTRNFEHFDEDDSMTAQPQRASPGGTSTASAGGAGPSAGGSLAAKAPDPNFIGYTFKNFLIVGEGQVAKKQPAQRPGLTSLFPGLGAREGTQGAGGGAAQ